MITGTSFKLPLISFIIPKTIFSIVPFFFAMAKRMAINTKRRKNFNGNPLNMALHPPATLDTVTPFSVTIKNPRIKEMNSPRIPGFVPFFAHTTITNTSAIRLANATIISIPLFLSASLRQVYFPKNAWVYVSGSCTQIIFACSFSTRSRLS